MSSSNPVRTLYQFPNGTWVENIAVRADGSLLLTSVNSPSLSLLDPFASAPVPVPIYGIPQVASLLGIVETTPDEFAIIAGNSSLLTGQVDLGSFAIWSVQLNGASYADLASGKARAQASKIADVPQALLLNGLTLSSTENVLLAADSYLGSIWSIDLDSGATNRSYSSSLMEPAITFPVGVDGVHVLDGYLYFTNMGQGILGRVSLDPSTGLPQGDASVVANTLTLIDHWDDFTFDSMGNAYLATEGGNTITRVSLATGQGAYIAGCFICAGVIEPTSAAFGRTQLGATTLYVTSVGGATLEGGLTVGGQIVAVDNVLSS